MSSVISKLWVLPLPLLLTGLALVVLVAAFITWFLAPAVRHLVLLRRIQRALETAPKNDAKALKGIFSVDRAMAHLWGEYEETLHQQTEERDGQVVVVSVRSTVPAETYFNHQFMVDGRLRTEFFRHLPGIFTGVGIIGTFTGLIGGLRKFQASLHTPQVGTPAASANALAPTPPETSLQITEPLRNLLHEVSTAFFVSAAAITAAMLVTLIEKALIASLYRRTEEIAHHIDAQFGAGAGEDYLARIVRASEDSASQSKILKDALVSDLRQLLHEISISQIRSAREDNQALATAISGSITDSLRQPLQDIAGTVRAASGDQSATASRMLQDVLASFGQKLNDLFGGQISGINSLNRETAERMTDVVNTLNTLVTGLESASAKSGDAMAARMAEAIEKMERRQESMNTQTAAFVDQLRQVVATSQSETTNHIQDALTSVGRQVAAMVATLEAVTTQSVEASRGREDATAARTSAAVGSMTQSVDAAVEQMGKASFRMQEAVERIATVTTVALDKMNYGADILNAAASRFAQAGDGVSGAMTQAGEVAGNLTQLAGSMTTGANALQRTVADYGAHRESVAALVTELHQIVESAKREASLTADVLSRIHEAASKLTAAQTQADAYLAGVNRVLGEAHESFAEATIKTLNRANIEFHAKLSTAVGLLSSSVQELETTLSARN